MNPARKTSYDFIIVGAGIAGSSLACELAPTGAVCLVDMESRAGYHATGRSAALFAPSYGGWEFRALTRASRGFFTAPPAGFCEHPLLQARGCLYLARTDQTTSLETMVAEVRASGGRIDSLPRSAALARVPRLRPDYLAAAAFDDDAMDIDVAALHQGFLRGARAAGTVLLTDTTIGSVRRQDGSFHVELPDGSLSAPVLIDAAGAWADELAQRCGARPLGLTPLRRSAALIDPPPGIDVSSWPAVIDADEEFYFKPDAGRLLISPADETPHPPGDAHPDEWDIATAVERVQAALDIDIRRVGHRWAGLRTFAPDRAPVVGFDPKIPGFFWCAGQGGYGIQSSPAMARTAAALARREPLPADIAAEGLRAESISPARFLR